ncbi:hypothetical protein V7S43_008451 [Phytophthora oleae]|uniref:Uncharacterized protein n=1 Tax=Phytophthora oleae TaxID=2107226 RepID=A0ABD3FJB0_9STRA
MVLQTEKLLEAPGADGGTVRGKGADVPANSETRTTVKVRARTSLMDSLNGRKQLAAWRQLTPWQLLTWI